MLINGVSDSESPSCDLMTDGGAEQTTAQSSPRLGPALYSLLHLPYNNILFIPSQTSLPSPESSHYRSDIKLAVIIRSIFSDIFFPLYSVLSFTDIGKFYMFLFFGVNDPLFLS